MPPVPLVLRLPSREADDWPDPPPSEEQAATAINASSNAETSRSAFMLVSLVAGHAAAASADAACATAGCAHAAAGPAQRVNAWRPGFIPSQGVRRCPPPQSRRIADFRARLVRPAILHDVPCIVMQVI